MEQEAAAGSLEQKEEVTPPEDLRLSMHPRSILAAVDAHQKFYTFMLEHPIELINDAELLDLYFQAGWNRALQWIQQHPDIYQEATQ